MSYASRNPDPVGRIRLYSQDLALYPARFEDGSNALYALVLDDQGNPVDDFGSLCIKGGMGRKLLFPPEMPVSAVESICTELNARYYQVCDEHSIVTLEDTEPWGR